MAELEGERREEETPNTQLDLKETSKEGELKSSPDGGSFIPVISLAEQIEARKNEELGLPNSDFNYKQRLRNQAGLDQD